MSVTNIFNTYNANIQPTNYTLVTDSASEPVTLSEAKDYLRVSGTDEDTLITNLIIAARQYGEKYTGRDFINKTWKTYLDRFPGDSTQIKIAKSKLQSITSIQYYKDDSLTAVSSSVYYNTDEIEYSSILPVDGQSWPHDEDDRRQAVVITFVSGYGAAASNVPQGIKFAMLAHIANMYENRGDCVDCDSAFKASKAASLYSPYVISKKHFAAIDGLCNY